MNKEKKDTTAQQMEKYKYEIAQEMGLFQRSKNQSSRQDKTC